MAWLHMPEPHATLKTTPIALTCYELDSETGGYTRLRSGMTLQHSTATLGVEAWILYTAGSRAKTLAQPAKEQESRGNGLGSGPSLHESFARYDRDSCLWKTSQCSLFGGLTPFSETWPKAGMMRDGCAYRLPMLERHTEDKEYSFWPTIRANKWGLPDSHGKPMDLTKQWPTPSVCGNYNRKGASPTSGDGLATAIGGQLNPTWVEWLMQFPAEFTALKPSEMLLSRRKRGKRGRS